MKDNVDEISRRGEKLEELETRSGRLEDLVKAFVDLQYFMFHIYKTTVIFGVQDNAGFYMPLYKLTTIFFKYVI